MSKLILRHCAIALLVFGFGVPGRTTSAARAAQSTNGVVAFVNVNVIPMNSERILADQTVLVRGDRIAEIGPANRIKVPAGAVRIDGKGKYLLPGLAEMHGHIPPPQAPQEFTDAVLFLYLANGVTTVRGMLGASGQLELRSRVNRGDVLSPTLYLAGPSFNGGSVNSPAQAAEMVKQQKREGWDLLKVHPGLTRDEYDAMARTAREVGIEFAGHVPAEVGLPHALAMGQKTIDHIDGYVEHLKAEDVPVDVAKLAAVVEQTKKAGAWIVPTMALWDTLLGVADAHTLMSYPELKYMPREQVADWLKAHRARQSSPQFNRSRAAQTASNRKLILKALHDGGVPVIFGTDAPQQFSVPGFSIHREMAAMLEAGLTPYQILRTATRNVGEYYKKIARIGTIAAGNRADLVLVNGNPLKDLRQLMNPAGVMARGRWVNALEISRRLENIASSNAPAASQ